MDRREFLKTTALIGVGTAAVLLNGCYKSLPIGMIEAYENSVKRKENISRIYNELPKHVHMAKTVTKYGNQEKNNIIFGTGIILEGKYLTMDHIVSDGLRPKRIFMPGGGFMEFPREVVSHETFLKDKKLEEYMIDSESDVAIFDLPKDLNLPDFPAKPSKKIELGDEVYIIGSPLLSGINIRKGNISDLNGIDGYYEGEKFIVNPNRDLAFGIDNIAYFGDSGGVCVNSDFELLGMGAFMLRGREGNHGLAYMLKIENFTKHL